MTKKHKFKPAIEGATAKDKGVVISDQRARWKLEHGQPTEPMIRMVRFIWMRGNLTWGDRHKLHAGVLGACLRAGYVWREPEHENSTDKLSAVDPRHIDRKETVYA